MANFSNWEFLKHALSTPLSSILLSSQLALDKNQDRNTSLKQILLSATYIKNLLAQAQNGLKPALFNLNVALSEIIFLNQCYHKEGAYSKNWQQTEGVMINGNKLLFQEVINCLLNNAIESYQAKDLNRIVLIKTQIAEKNLEIAISDGGEGLTWFEKTLAGKKFYSLKDSHQGIGLFYCKKFLTEHFSASFKLISRKHHGSTALITIPLFYYPGKNRNRVRF